MLQQAGALSGGRLEGGEPSPAVQRAPHMLLPMRLHSSLQHPLLFWLSPTAATDTVLMRFSLCCQPSTRLLRVPQLRQRFTEQWETLAHSPSTIGQSVTQCACRQQGWKAKLGSQASRDAAETGRLGFTGWLLWRALDWT